MPGKPKEQSRSVEAEAGALKLYIAIFEDRSTAYLAAYTDYPEEYLSTIAEDDLLDSVVQTGVDSVGGTLTRQTNFPLGALRGREAEFETQAQGAQPAMLGKGRYFLAGNRLYQLMVVAPQRQGLPAAAQKFLDSFKLVEN